jgi:hypothetical protein
MSDPIDPIACPCCMHELTLRARLAGTEDLHDDPALMRWHRPPGGVRGQVFSQWDAGWWQCRCGLRLTPHMAGVLVDAALMHAFPDCDSITEEGIHVDTKRAFIGGEVRP